MNERKRGLVLYDPVYNWWRVKLTRKETVYRKVIDRNFSDLRWESFKGFIPENNTGKNILIIVPWHGDGDNCRFKSLGLLEIQSLLDEAVQKGWSRIHFHSCETSTGFRKLKLLKTPRKYPVVVTGFKNRISAERRQKSSTADEYMIGGCLQSVPEASLRSLVEYRYFSKKTSFVSKIKGR